MGYYFVLFLIGILIFLIINFFLEDKLRLNENNNLGIYFILIFLALLIFVFFLYPKFNFGIGCCGCPPEPYSENFSCCDCDLTFYGNHMLFFRYILPIIYPLFIYFIIYIIIDVRNKKINNKYKKEF